jgi:hypothetical protein
VTNRVLNPRERIVAKQHVARRSAAESGHAAEQANADPIHAATPGGERRGHRLRDDGDEIESVKQHGLLGFPRSRSVLQRRAWPRRQSRLVERL